MLDGNADALHWEERNRQVVGKYFTNPRQVRLGDEGIDAQRQMRPMLLHCRERQHRDPAGGLSAGGRDLLPRHVHPVALRQVHRVLFVVLIYA